MTSEDRSFFSTIRIRFAIILAVIGAAWPAIAQEDATSPPAPLEFPTEAPPEASKGFLLSLLRYALETSGDAALCAALMQVDGKSGECLPEYKAKVASNSGALHWASNARPLSCGTSCFGRPFMMPEENTNRPNLRQARLSGNLSFVLDGPGADRGLTYFFDAYFTCKAKDGARNGDLVLDLKFGAPVLGEPGALETVLSELFTLGWLSDRIDQEIKKQAPGIPGQKSVIGRCQSVGIDKAQDPKFDLIKYDEPASTGGGASAARAAAVRANTVAAIRDTATIRFTSIVRKALPVTIAPEHAHPGDIAAQQFSVFVNGQQRFLPIAGQDLPPEGGTATINFCKTVDLTGANQLQIIFANDLGGAVWSQFSRGANFGSGGSRAMTTSRTIILPARQGPNGLIKPSPYPLREFELTYDIAFSASPASVGMSAGDSTASAGGATAGAAGATAGNSAGGGKTVKAAKSAKTMRFNKNAVIGKPQAEAKPQEPCVQL